MSARDLKDRILYEDNHIIIINKLVGEIVQGDKTGDEPLSETVKNFIKVRDNKPGNVFLGVAHRLDRPVSGAVIFAKTSKALSRLNEMFRNGDIHKSYYAIVKNKPESNEQMLTHHLSRNEKKNKSFAHSKPTKDSKEARLRYKIIDKSDKYFLLEVELITGRHHQIRCQLAAIDCAIKGDLKYGAPRSNPDGGISLHARNTKFVHPVSKNEIDIVAPFPTNDLWQYFNATK